MSDLLVGGQDPRIALAGMGELVFSPPLAAPDGQSPAVEGQALRENEIESLGTPDQLVVRAYYDRWVEPMVYPRVRKAQERDYRRHIEGYVLPRIGGLPVGEVTTTVLCELRDELLMRGGEAGNPLSRSYVRNIVGASFRSLVGAALEDGLIAVDPYRSKRWRKWPGSQLDEPEADPFMPHERDRIVEWFRSKSYTVNRRRRPHPPFLGWVAIQFYAGLSPSEASGLQWRDVELERSFALIRRSYHLGRYGPTKNKKRRRHVELAPVVVEILREIMPLHINPQTPVFPNTSGEALEPKSFSHWYDCQRALGVRVRGAYSMKDSFVSLALMTPGMNVQWLERQTGVALETLKTHYAKWHPSVGQSELEKIEEFERNPALTPTLTPKQPFRETKDGEKPAKTQ
jgi:integrase